MIKTPVIIVNFKAYKEAAGEKAITLARMAERVSKEFGLEIVVSPNIVDLRDVTVRAEIPVIAQHVDPIPYGAYTGHISPYHIKEIGAKGSLINHSEKKLAGDVARGCISLLSNLQLDSILCAATPKEIGEILKESVKATAVAIEPPELIGSGRAVSKYKPEIIKDAVVAVKDFHIPLLCGAGIVSGDDVKRALELGAEGILVASGVVKAPNPEEVLRDFASKM
jgi:triosephosphate isomerase